MHSMQALARMGAHVTGIEPQQNNIKAAVAHAQADPVVADRTTYLAVTAEELASTGEYCLSNKCVASVCMYPPQSSVHPAAAGGPKQVVLSAAMHCCSAGLQQRDLCCKGTSGALCRVMRHASCTSVKLMQWSSSIAGLVCQQGCANTFVCRACHH